MLFLLPPSETKRIGGKPPSIAQVSQTFGALTESRNQLVDSVVKLSSDGPLAQRILKLSNKQLAEIEHNANLWNADTLSAIERYSGTLYEAIGVTSLSQSALARAREIILIQSALFGLICASDRIPYYRLSASSALPNVNLKNHWAKVHQSVFARLAGAAPLIDLRSKSYAELAPIPIDIEHYWVEVVTRADTGEIRALNHFNKKSKGELIRAVLESPKAPATVRDLVQIASHSGFELVEDGNQLRLIIPGN